MKKLFRERLFQLHAERGTPLKKLPTIGRKELDVFTLFVLIERCGGFKNVLKHKLFKKIGDFLKLPPTVTNVGYMLRTKYEQLVLPFEATLQREFYPNSPSFAPRRAREPLASAVPPAPVLGEHRSCPPLPKNFDDKNVPSRLFAPINTFHQTAVFPDPLAKRPVLLSADRARAGPPATVDCPGCAAAVPLAQFQQHLFDCNTDFYIECFGVTPPSASADSKRATLFTSWKQSSARDRQSFHVHEAFFSGAVGSEEVVELLRHLAARETRRAQMKRRRKPASAVEKMLPRSAVSTQRVAPELLRANEFPTGCSSSAATADADATDCHFPEKRGGDARAVPPEELSTFSFRAIQPVLQFIIRVGAASRQAACFTEHPGALFMAQNLLEALPKSMLPPIVRAWPLSHLHFLNPYSLTDGILTLLKLSPCIKTLQLDTPPPQVSGLIWPTQADAHRLSELVVSNGNISTEALGKALEAYPALRVLRVHACRRVSQWPPGLRDAARAWLHENEDAGSPLTPCTEPAFPGQILRELTILDVHPYFNIGMIAEAAPFVHVLRISYVLREVVPEPIDQLEAEYSERMRRYRLCTPAFAEQEEREDTVPAAKHALADVEEPLLFPFLSLEHGTLPDVPPVFRFAMTERPHVEPTMYQTFPKFSPEFYRLRPLRDLEFVQIEGPAIANSNSLAEWMPSVRELILVSLDIYPFRLSKLLERLTPEELAHFQGHPARDAERAQEPALSRASPFELLAARNLPPLSPDQITRKFFPCAHLISVQECHGNFFDIQGMSHRTFTEITFDTAPKGEDVECSE